MLRLTAGIARSIVRTTSGVVRLAAPRMGMCQSRTPAKTGEASKLSEKLDSEIKYEKENAPDVNKSLEELKSKGWQVKNDGTLIELKKQTGDKTVFVSFTVRSPQAEQENEEKKEEEENDEEDMMNNDYCEFTVYVKRPGVDKLMFADYLSSGGQSSINSIGFCRDYETHRRTNRFDKQTTAYQGPDLESMDENLVEGLEKFFEGLGVDEQLVALVEDYSLDAEHPHYVSWLEELRTFIR